jgi:putative addiction module component (TIGR02574 family)
MPRDAAQLLQEALELPAEARAALADRLLNSIDTQVDEDAEQAWHEEIDRRLASLDGGTAQPIAWDAVRTKLSDQLPR